MDSTNRFNTNGSPFPLNGERKARGLLAVGDVIRAIKLLRERNGIGLKEAKDIVDGWRRQPPVHRSVLRAPDEIRALKTVCEALTRQPRERRRHILPAAAILTDISLPGVI